MDCDIHTDTHEQQVSGSIQQPVFGVGVGVNSHSSVTPDLPTSIIPAVRFVDPQFPAGNSPMDMIIPRGNGKGG